MNRRTRLQRRMINAVEVFADVELQEEGELPGERLSRRLQTGDAALALAACIRVVDQPALEDRLADIHDRVVQHALLETGRRD